MLKLWLADNQLGDHSRRQRSWKDKLDESICAQREGSPYGDLGALTRHMIIGQQEVQRKLQGDNWGRLPYKRGLGR